LSFAHRLARSRIIDFVAILTRAVAAVGLVRQSERSIRRLT